MGGIAIMLLLGMAVPGVAAAPLSGAEEPIDIGEHVALAKAVVAYWSTLEEARMDGVIGYITGISAGAGAGMLPDLRAEFAGTADSVPGMTTMEEIKTAREKMKGTLQEFRAGTANLMKQYNGDVSALKAAVNASVESQADILAALRAAVWEARGTHRMDTFDRHVARAEEILAKLSARGVDVTAAQAALDTVKADRPALESAFASGDKAALKTALEQVKKDWAAFMDALKAIKGTAKEQRVTMAKENAAGTASAGMILPAAAI
jgi:predicted nucleic-acid-binding protein